MQFVVIMQTVVGPRGRLMDPVSGRVLLDGVDIRRIRFSSLRERVVMVPQEGFLVDGSLAANTAWRRPGASAADVRNAVEQMGLREWVDGLAQGLDTAVGQRGGSLSAGERQLVALARACLADPDLLVLDEATSAVDPATEVRLRRALEGATRGRTPVAGVPRSRAYLGRGRTSVAIAHRLSTADAADLVVVVDAGRVVDIGSHPELLTRCPAYQRLHASRSAQRRPVPVEAVGGEGRR